MPEWFVAILLGVIEGVTEFLPVSSTGHLLLAEHWLPTTKALKSDLFTIVIQPAAALALFGVFRERIQSLAQNFSAPATRDYLAKLFAAFLITGIGGLALKRAGLKLPETVAPVAWATLIGGVLFLAIEWLVRGRKLASEVTWTVAIAVGAAQLVAAVFPGTSRSGITILIALLLGLSRPAAAEFSFLLGIPTLLAAGALQTLSALKHSSEVVRWDLIALGSAGSMITAFVVVKWLLRFVQTHTFTVFAWYRIGLGILLLAFAR